MMKVTLGFRHCNFPCWWWNLLLAHGTIMSFCCVDDGGTYLSISALLFPLVALMMMKLTLGSRHYYNPCLHWWWWNLLWDLATIITLVCIDDDRTYFGISSLLLPLSALVMIELTLGSRHSYYPCLHWWLWNFLWDLGIIITLVCIDDDGTYFGISVLLLPLVHQRFSFAACFHTLLVFAVKHLYE